VGGPLPDSALTVERRSLWAHSIWRPMISLPLEDLSNLTPDQRLHEIAIILARGIHRLRASGLTAAIWEDPASEESAKNGLELSATSRPDVSGG
jgi:hypothetical protein